MCSIPSGFFSLTARACAVRTAFLICCKTSATDPKSHEERDTYLSTIEVAPSKPIVIIGRELIDLNTATNSLDLAEEGFPYTVLGLGSKFAVAESNVDAGLEGRIEGFDAIGGQEEDALEVF